MAAFGLATQFLHYGYTGSAASRIHLAERCFEAGLESVGDFDCVNINNMSDLICCMWPQDVDFLCKLATTATEHNLGACSAPASRSLAAPPRPFVVSPAMPHCTISATTIKDAIVRVQRAAAVTTASVPGFAAGPRKGIDELCSDMFGGATTLEQWQRDAHDALILGSASRSHAETLSALRAWKKFADMVLGLNGHALPPSVTDLVTWAMFFKSTKVYRNYIAKLKLACLLCDLDTSAFGDPRIAKAKLSLKGRGVKSKQPWRMLRADDVVQLLRLARQFGQTALAMLILAAYTFSLRVPSEGLPMCVGTGGQAE